MRFVHRHPSFEVPPEVSDDGFVDVSLRGVDAQFGDVPSLNLRVGRVDGPLYINALDWKGGD